MRTTLVSVLAVLAQWGILANAQPQAGALPGWPAATNGYLVHPPTKRLFFFMSDPKNIGRPEYGRPADRKNIVRPAVFGRSAQAAGKGGFLWPYSFTAPVSQNPAHPNLKFPQTSLQPLQSLPRHDLWFPKPKNSRLFFFSKP